MIRDVKVALYGPRSSTELCGRSAIVMKHTEQRRNGQSPSLSLKQSFRNSWTSDNRGICGNCGSPQEWSFHNWFDQKQNAVEPQEVSVSDVVCSCRSKSKQFTVKACKSSASFPPSSCRRCWIIGWSNTNCGHHPSPTWNLLAHSGNLCSSATIAAVRPR